MADPIYIACAVPESAARDCLTKSINTLAFSQVSLRVLFITAITLAMNNDDSSNLE